MNEVLAPLVMDSNEPDEIHERLVELKVNVERQKIAPGDYVVGPIGIERKSLTDFFSSIIKKRLFEQVRRLREAYPQPLVLLEGDLAEISTYRHPQSLLGAIAALEITERVPILTTADREQSAILLSVIWKRQDTGAASYGLRHKPKALSLGQQQRFLVEGLPHVGETLAKNLLERFGTVRAVFGASRAELEHVPKIGGARAAEIERLVTAAYEGEQAHLEDEGPADDEGL